MSQIPRHLSVLRHGHVLRDAIICTNTIYIAGCVKSMIVTFILLIFFQCKDNVNEALKRINLSKQRRNMVFLTHGFRGHIKNEWLHKMKDAFLKTDIDCIVAIVGWRKGSKKFNYPQAASNCLEVHKHSFHTFKIYIVNR